MGSSVPLGDRCGWSVAVLKLAWSGLGALLGALGVVLGGLGAILDVLRRCRGCLGAVLGQSWVTGAVLAALVKINETLREPVVSAIFKHAISRTALAMQVWKANET